MSRRGDVLLVPIVLALLLAAGPASGTCGLSCCAASARTAPAAGPILSASMPCCESAGLASAGVTATFVGAAQAPAVASSATGFAGRPVVGGDGTGRLYRPESSPRLVCSDGLYTRNASFLI